MSNELHVIWNQSYDNGITFNADTGTWFAAFSAASSTGSIVEFNNLQDLSNFTNQISTTSYGGTGINFNNGIAYNPITDRWHGAFASGGSGTIATYATLADLSAANPESSIAYSGSGLDYDNGIEFNPTIGTWFGAFSGGGGTGGILEFASLSDLAAGNRLNSISYASTSLDFDNGIAFFAAVPEPSSASFLALCVLATASRRRRCPAVTGNGITSAQ